MSAVANRLWKRINRCVLCGSKLIYQPSKEKGARHPEGVKYCEQNHRRFCVHGKYDESGTWHLGFRLPH